MSEILQIAKKISEEHEIELSKVVEYLAEALKIAIQKKYGDEADVRIETDVDNEIFDVYVKKKVTERPMLDSQISIEEARKIKPDVKPGEYVEEKVDAKSLGRIAVTTIKNVITKLLRDIEKHKAYEEYKEYIGKIIVGEVWSIGANNNVIIDFKNAIGILPKREQGINDKYVVGEHIKAYVLDVIEEPKQVKLILSRTHPGFVKELFKKEVPEVREGSVEIKAVAREPSRRTKVAVYSKDSRIDPIGTCVGSKGVRIAAIVRELGDEKIDVIKWSADPSIYIRNAMSPAKVISVEIDEELKKAKVYVDDAEYSMAIGKGGVNAKLAAKLTGYNIDIAKISEREDSSDGDATLEDGGNQ
ncbi:transcription termination factor NusA [Hippea sp. KM1]|uniref:transcription termination factor NusA n=1 Tax=Hippea sp. KM1 TaxID=944481 RepID=UPI0004B57E38|nr:transcription termination factor NusA [Hippea sp. KM1]